MSDLSSKIEELNEKKIELIELEDTISRLKGEIRHCLVEMDIDLDDLPRKKASKITKYISQGKVHKILLDIGPSTLDVVLDEVRKLKPEYTAESLLPLISKVATCKEGVYKAKSNWKSKQGTGKSKK